MSEKLNRTCIMCNTKYSYCNRCGKDAQKPTWMSILCGDNCHDIYRICVEQRDGVITTEEAYKKLSKRELSKLEDFEEGFKNRIKTILSSKIETKVETETESKVKIDTEVVKSANAASAPTNNSKSYKKSASQKKSGTKVKEFKKTPEV